MQAVWVECVPNFSEGRRPEVVAQLAEAIASVPGVHLLDSESDPDHNRCVITFVGPPQPVLEAAFRGVARAVQLIDLRRHSGAHPRIGAADVVPLVPLKGITAGELVPMARRLGERIARELDVPVFLYGEAATAPPRRELAYLRRGNFEGLQQAMESDPGRQPDFGPPRVHPTAGATAVGVRPPLIAYNIELNTPDLEVARAVARAVRESSGGLVNVRAMGVRLQRGTTQVSMNLLDYRKTPIYRAFELVACEARRFGALIVSSEIVGLVPEDALLDCAEHYLRLRRFNRRQLLERRLAELEAASRQAPGGTGGEVPTDLQGTGEPVPRAGSLGGAGGHGGAGELADGGDGAGAAREGEG